MTKLDQFESVFKSADKAVYTYDRPTFDRVLVVTDLDEADTADITVRVRSFLTAIDEAGTRWGTLTGDAFGSVQALLERIEERKPDLIVTYRHLHSEAWRWPYSLGEYLDVMTQATPVPVLVLPHPDAERALPHTVANTDCVMAITDHLTADSRLINWALRLTARSGTCWLTHVESQRQFDHFLSAVEKIPEIETDDVRELVEAQLLKEPRDYARACREELAQQEVDVSVEEIVSTGHRLSEYKQLIASHAVELLVMHTRDEDQFAMHGLAYPLAVELRHIPLLLV